MSTFYNPKMVTLARESRGLSQKDLAHQVSILDQSNLSKMERGLLTINEKAIIAIGEALNFPLDFFIQTEVKATLDEVYYRKRKTTAKKPLKLFEAKRDIIIKSIDNLLDGIELPDCSIPLVNLEKGFTPEIVAKNIRSYFRVAKGPIANLVELLENEGIIIHFIEAPEKVRGCTIISDKNVPIIFINKHHPAHIKRWTICHELGHLIMHLDFLVPAHRKPESETDNFVAELLMPAYEIRNDLKNLTYGKLSDLKAYWGVSYAALIRRANDLKLISDNKAKSLYIQRSQYGHIKNEPSCGVTFGTPRFLKHIIDFTRNDLGYSKVELLKILKLNDLDYQELILNVENRFRLRAVKGTGGARGCQKSLGVIGDKNNI